MSYFSSLVSAALFSAAANLIAPLDARAYLDPGAGSALIAILVGGFSGLLFLLQTWRNKVRERFGRNDREEEESVEEKSKEQA